MSPSSPIPVACLVSALLGAPVAASEALSPVEEVASLLAGTFDSRRQAETSPAGPQAERIVAVRVPGSRLGGGAPVLYVERALLSAPERAYRPRFYRIEEAADGSVLLLALEPKEPVSVAGKWRDPADLALFASGDVVGRVGCAVRLQRTSDGWEGGTEGTSCPNATAGARYATSRLRLRPDGLVWWDRGFDLAERQVWGAKEGPTLFERRPVGPPITGK